MGSGLHPQISLVTRLPWGLRICMSTEFPGDADAAGLGITFR